MEEKKKPLSLDEVMESVSSIAQEDGHRDQFKALKLLATAQNAAIVLPAPLSREEKMDRLGRLMKGCGVEDSQIAFARAFSRHKTTAGQAPNLHLDDLTAEQLSKVRHIKGVKTFNKFFEVSKSGVPKGYPKGKGRELQVAWLKREALKIILDREQASLDRQAKHVPVIETPDQPSWFRKRETEQSPDPV